jgi:hypothetical protein
MTFLIVIPLTDTKYSVVIWYEDSRLKTESWGKYADMKVGSWCSRLCSKDFKIRTQHPARATKMRKLKWYAPTTHKEPEFMMRMHGLRQGLITDCKQEKDFGSCNVSEWKSWLTNYRTDVNLSTQQLVCSHLLTCVSCYSPALKMEAIRSSETSVQTRATWCYNPEDNFLHFNIDL